MATIEGGFRMDNGGVSAGEIGGIFAGLVALLAALGKAGQWLLNYKNAREESKAARLRVWEDSLNRREREMRSQTEARLKAMERKIQAVSGALFEMIGEMQVLDPTSPVLARAKLLFQREYPLDLEIPDEIKDLVGRLGDKEGEVQ